MQYQSGSTGVGTTAAEAFAAGRGVCQDFAHVFLALARRAGLAARYVNGLSLGEGSSHAWCEVWLDGVWTGIDPTRGVWADDSYIRFGVGRDFADCPFERGVFRGSARQRQSVYMKVSEIG
ncbi:MAG: transglutaminase family protein [Oscillospiraceae bacterium]|nr:transglutaminase family protein [Oscillospiraceae bacterium]